MSLSNIRNSHSVSNPQNDREEEGPGSVHIEMPPINNDNGNNSGSNCALSDLTSHSTMRPSRKCKKKTKHHQPLEEEAYDSVSMASIGPGGKHKKKTKHQQQLEENIYESVRVLSRDSDCDSNYTRISNVNPRSTTGSSGRHRKKSRHQSYPLTKTKSSKYRFKSLTKCLTFFGIIQLFVVIIYVLFSQLKFSNSMIATSKPTTSTSDDSLASTTPNYPSTPQDYPFGSRTTLSSNTLSSSTTSRTSKKQTTLVNSSYNLTTSGNYSNFTKTTHNVTKTTKKKKKKKKNNHAMTLEPFLLDAMMDVFNNITNAGNTTEVDTVKVTRMLRALYNNNHSKRNSSLDEATTDSSSIKYKTTTSDEVTTAGITSTQPKTTASAKITTADVSSAHHKTTNSDEVTTAGITSTQPKTTASAKITTADVSSAHHKTTNSDEVTTAGITSTQPKTTASAKITTADVSSAHHKTTNSDEVTTAGITSTQPKTTASAKITTADVSSTHHKTTTSDEVTTAGITSTQPKTTASAKITTADASSTSSKITTEKTTRVDATTIPKTEKSTTIGISHTADYYSYDNHTDDNSNIDDTKIITSTDIMQKMSELNNPCLTNEQNKKLTDEITKLMENLNISTEEMKKLAGELGNKKRAQYVKTTDTSLAQNVICDIEGKLKELGSSTSNDDKIKIVKEMQAIVKKANDELKKEEDET